uniref:ATP synthase complex subunit 8 n=1 Tax=Xyleborinus saxesenii TaxID=1230758 RepID=A0A343A5E7_9CUCU|nr:ATP synthase F0 subunit 8 [Xyleborinus saxesenii]
MPQMAPISWMSLYTMFIILFMMTCILIYFIFLYTPKMLTSKKTEMKYSWKW